MLDVSSQNTTRAYSFLMHPLPARPYLLPCTYLQFPRYYFAYTTRIHQLMPNHYHIGLLDTCLSSPTALGSIWHQINNSISKLAYRWNSSARPANNKHYLQLYIYNLKKKSNSLTIFCSPPAKFARLSSFTTVHSSVTLPSSEATPLLHG